MTVIGIIDARIETTQIPVAAVAVTETETETEITPTLNDAHGLFHPVLVTQNDHLLKDLIRYLLDSA